MSDAKAEDGADATVERIAREWADADVKDCAFSAEAQARLWPGLYGMTTRSTARVLAALKPGDMLPGDGTGRLVVVREEVAEKPGSGEPLPSWLCSREGLAPIPEGKQVRLEISENGEFREIGTMVSDSVTISFKTVAETTTAQIAGRSVIKDLASAALLRRMIFESETRGWRVSTPNHGIIVAAFQVAGLNYLGGKTGEEQFEITLESVGPLTVKRDAETFIEGAAAIRDLSA